MASRGHLKSILLFVLVYELLDLLRYLYKLDIFFETEDM
jgi:hypothetical protein